MGTLANVSPRHFAYAVMIALAAGHVAGRILSAEYVLEPSLHRPAELITDPRRPWPITPPPALPLFSSNDRSRWATIRALVDEGTYSIGRRIEYPALGRLSHMQAQAVLIARALDVSASWATHGILGPPLLPPPLYSDHGLIFEPGWTSVDKILDPETKLYYSSKPPLLPTLIAGEYWLLKQFFGWSFDSHASLVIKVILFSWNWLPLIVYLMMLARLLDRFAQTDWARIFAVGTACFGTFITTFSTTLNNHTIAALGLVFALYPFVRVWCDNLNGLPPLVRYSYYCLAGFFAGWTACNELPAMLIVVALALLLMFRSPSYTLLLYIPSACLPIAAFMGTNYLALGEWWPAYEKFGSIWYEYPGSYWANRRGIDAAREPAWLYSLHVLIGHHGILSLTPVLLLAVPGMFYPRIGNPSREARYVYLLYGIALVSIVVFLFYAVYVYYALQTSNYGGWTSGPRWFFWLTPLWLLAMLPTADRLAASRTGRFIGYVLLVFSALSAAYPAWNPWRHPWIYDAFQALGWIRY